jgi:hypothetical protein
MVREGDKIRRERYISELKGDAIAMRDDIEQIHMDNGKKQEGH